MSPDYSLVIQVIQTIVEIEKNIEFELRIWQIKK